MVLLVYQDAMVLRYVLLTQGMINKCFAEWIDQSSNEMSRLSLKHSFSQSPGHVSSGQKYNVWTRNLPIFFLLMPCFLIAFCGGSLLFSHRKVTWCSTGYFQLRMWLYINQKLKLRMQTLSLEKHDWAFRCSSHLLCSLTALSFSPEWWPWKN